MHLISSRAAWRKLLRHDCNLDKYRVDSMPEPTEYPCYVYRIVGSWNYQEYAPVILYAKDLQKMIRRLEDSQMGKIIRKYVKDKANAAAK